jgi:primosomal protein N' (replication factor Y)
MTTQLVPTYIAPARPLPPLTYLAPVELSVGMRVRIKLRNAVIMGVTLGPDINPPQVTLKPIIDVIDPFPLIPKKLWQLLRFTSNYYNCSIADLLPLCIPWTTEVNWQSTIDGYQLNELRNCNNWQKLKDFGLGWETGDIKLPDLFCSRKLNKLKGNYTINICCSNKIDMPKLTHTQTRVMSILNDVGGTILENTLCNKAKVSLSVIKRLEYRNLIKRVKNLDLPLKIKSNPTTINNYYIELNDEQKQAVADVNISKFNIYLLYGITGSGKTEVYLKLAERVLATKKCVLWLVPEIGLTPSLISKLETRFPNQIAVGHAGLTPSEKQTDIIRLLQNDAKIFVGVRNAVIAPLKNIGLIVVDEEHESSYKSDDNPRINARDLAIKRAQLEDCPVVLGSATPSLESWQSANNGRYKLLRLKRRATGAHLPTIEIVDLRESYKEQGKRILLSETLLKAINNNLERGEQIMLLLNRRGFENFWMCRACGKTIDCPHCSISLTYHQKLCCLRCHLCGLKIKPLKNCTYCNAEQFRGVGEGTEQVEEKLKTLFPNARILRLDRDTTKHKGYMQSGLLAVERGEIDILVGTQMLAKGHNFPMLTLVGIINADLGLKMADFRASEHTFQLLTQVAGRAGRSKIAGHVILQTYNPNHPSIIHAVEQNFETFAKEEMFYRKTLEYPPYTAMSLYRSTGKTPELALEPLIKLRSQLEKMPNLRILGPLEAPVAKIKNLYRMQLLIRAKDKKQLSNVVNALKLNPGGSIILDRDPLNF